MEIHAKPPLLRTRCSLDLFADCFRTVRANMESCLSRDDPRAFQLELYWLSGVSPRMQTRFIDEGSFYPSLLTALRNRDYQKILNALEQAEVHPEYFTADIRLCQALCHLNLMDTEACERSLVALSQQCNISEALQRLIAQSPPEIAELYTDLQNYFLSINPSN
ncbi:MAG: hypothetical protein JSS60_06030 [Verrucomicrobia bacterium]|nr:hypothetical protein [Verrucomicrobiota bacterium]